MKEYSFDVDIEISAECDGYDGDFVEANSEKEAEAIVEEIVKRLLGCITDDEGISFEEPRIRVTVYEVEEE